MNRTRRDVLKIGAMTAAVGGLPMLGAGGPSRTRVGQAQHRGAVRNVIFMVVDGMSAGVLPLAEAFSRQVREQTTQWARLAARSDVVHGYFDVASLDSLVPDSASAASAWGSGSKVNNGWINMLPDGTSLTPLATLAKQTGRRVGLVTTTRLTHATPAAFAASVPSRQLELDIASQYLDTVDVLLGGGARMFDDPLLQQFQAALYAVYTSPEEFSAQRGFANRKLGLFAESHMPYVIDVDHALEPAVPTLAEMSRAALQSLQSSPDGFLLQIEGGRVDHAAHAKDAASLLWEQLHFDDTIRVVTEFMQGRDDTLLILTSDHGNANPGLNGIGSWYRGSNTAFERIAAATASFEHLVRRVREATTVEDIRNVVAQLAGVEIDTQHAQVLRALTFTSRSHTADWTPLMAIGPGSERFHGLCQATEAFLHMTQLMGIEHRNPVATKQPVRRGVR